MSRFNQPSATTKVQNYAGGEAYSQSPELELISILLTSFANDKFYEKADQTFDRLKNLLVDTDKEFAAKAAIYARTEFGMRSITHVLASELARHISGKEWAKSFFQKIVYRPDDMTEIVSYHLAVNGKLPNSMKKGLASAFGKFDKYQLAKYRSAGKDVKLIDVVNLVHPKGNDKNAEALSALVKGELKAFDTWETELTKAGQSASNDEEKSDFKKEAWTKLIKEKKIGYFALLRNLRNIIEQAPDMVEDAIALLNDEALIKRSLVLPFRFISAYDEVSKIASSKARSVMIGITSAVDKSLSNVPKFAGETLVVLDVSGSMSGKPSVIGSLFSATLLKTNNSDFIVFSDKAQYRNVNTMDSITTIANSIRFACGGTNFHSIFETANKKYDRIIILSDMQGWIGGNTPTVSYNNYKKKYGANPFIYSFDLNGYGSMQFPEQNVFAIAGFSEKIFDVMVLLEQDKKALIKKINEVVF